MSIYNKPTYFEVLIGVLHMDPMDVVEGLIKVIFISVGFAATAWLLTPLRDTGWMIFILCIPSIYILINLLLITHRLWKKS